MRRIVPANNPNKIGYWCRPNDTGFNLWGADGLTDGRAHDDGVVRGHPRSSAMSPFDRAHTISYSSLIETMRLSCTVSEIRQVICRNSPTSTYPTCIWRPRWEWPRSNFEKIFGIRKLEFLAIVWRCLRVHTFSHYSRTPTCDRHRHTDRHTNTRP